jgi:AcrR family transcriptional regulator
VKISREQKLLNRAALLRAAVDVIGEHGFESASLRQISVEAGMSEPVIYSYFPSKAHLLFAYVEDSIDRALQSVSKVKKIGELGFSEQVQLLMEAHLEVLSEDTEFVKKIFPLVFITGLTTAQESLAESRRRFATFVRQCLQEAVKAGEIMEPPFGDVVVSMFWDFHVGILHYWLNDSSKQKRDTSEMMQKSLAVISSVLNSAFLPRVVDLAYFLIRTHLLTPSIAKKKDRPKILDDSHD